MLARNGARRARPPRLHRRVHESVLRLEVVAAEFEGIAHRANRALDVARVTAVDSPGCEQRVGQCRAQCLVDDRVDVVAQRRGGGAGAFADGFHVLVLPEQVCARRANHWREVSRNASAPVAK